MPLPHRPPTGPAADLSAFVDDDLPWWRRRAIAAHLRRCEPCARAVAHLRHVRRLAREVAPPAVPDVLRLRLDAIWADWRAEAGPGPSGPGP